MGLPVLQIRGVAETGKSFPEQSEVADAASRIKVYYVWEGGVDASRNVQGGLHGNVLQRTRFCCI